MVQTTPGIELIDTHCHLEMDAYRDDLELVMQNARDLGISNIITIGIDYASSQKAVQLARRFPNIFATVGVHPHHADNADESQYDAMIELARQPENKVVGYGEIGLDYFKGYVAQDIQLRHFARQLRLAKDLELPVIVHDRDAHEDTMRLLLEAAPFPAGGIMHCFSGDLELARQVLELGFHISIPGIVTFKKSEALQEVAREIPLERMVLETDGPFLAPVPHRSKRNEPGYIIHTADKIAELRGIDPMEVALHTTRNAKQLFRLNK